ncbi:MULTISPECIES: LuxR C-terminal-related transcriptional regulator [unclassified Streptomyces]|uniref:helix-turn-helix transcriptional regulator n=1 Tax=unclassified Streptomyces TaxID=2593676 RepID=UPI0036EA9325
MGTTAYADEWSTNVAQGLGGAYERMLAVAVAALHERDPGRLWPSVAGALPDLIGGEVLIYKLDDWSESGGTLGLSPDAAPDFAALGDEDMGLLRAGFPFAQHYAERRDRAPVTAGRAAGRAWSASRTARLIDDVMDMDHALGIPLPESGTPITGCLVYRSGRDFTDEEVVVAGRLQPLLAGIEQQRQLLERVVVPSGDDVGLTPRESTVLLLLGDALTAAAMGRRLGISERTVHKHVANIYRKLGTHDRLGTVLRAQQLGLVPAPASLG